MGRSNWKGPNIYTKLYNSTIERNSKIIPKVVGLKLKTHNGILYQEILITKDMLNHKVGEFSQTRKKFSFKKSKQRKSKLWDKK